MDIKTIGTSVLAGISGGLTILLLQGQITGGPASAALPFASPAFDAARVMNADVSGNSEGAWHVDGNRIRACWYVEGGTYSSASVSCTAWTD